MIRAFWFAVECFLVYREQERAGGLAYVQFKFLGVPYATGVFAVGRSAWKASDFAANYFAERGYVTKGD